MLGRRIEKKIGQILVEAEAITGEQLTYALKKQRENGHRIGENLIDLGYIDEDEITRYIAEQYRIPYISLDRYEFSTGILDIIPEDISKIHGLIPLDLIGDILTVGTVDVPDKRILKRMEVLTGFKIQVMLVTGGDFNRYMQKVYNLSIVYNDKWFKGRVKRYITTPSYEGRERRRFPRFNKELRIKYEFRDEYNINASINLSQGGILIKSKSPVPVNSNLIVRMELPTSLEDVIIISRVVRVKRVPGEDVFLIALSFSSMDVKDSRRLGGFLKSLK